MSVAISAQVCNRCGSISFAFGFPFLRGGIVLGSNDGAQSFAAADEG